MQLLVLPRGSNVLTPLLYRVQVGRHAGVSFPACLLPGSQEVEFFGASVLHSSRCLQCELAGMLPSESSGLMFNAALQPNAQQSRGAVFSQALRRRRRYQPLAHNNFSFFFPPSLYGLLRVIDAQVGVLLLSHRYVADF